jgi:hypothetical protein
MHVSNVVDQVERNRHEPRNFTSYTDAQIAGARRASDIEFVPPFKAKTRLPAGAQPVMHEKIVLGYMHKPKKVLSKQRRLGDQCFRSLRTREIDDLAKYRHWSSAPNEAEARALATAMASVTDSKRAAIWIRTWCVNIDPDEQDEIIADAAENPRKWKAAEFGELLGLTREERAKRKITTFRAASVTKKEMTAERQRKDRERQRAKRAEARRGKPLSREKLKPWLGLGISRSTFNRRLKKARQQFSCEPKCVGEPKSVGGNLFPLQQTGFGSRAASPPAAW